LLATEQTIKILRRSFNDTAQGLLDRLPQLLCRAWNNENHLFDLTSARQPEECLCCNHPDVTLASLRRHIFADALIIRLLGPLDRLLPPGTVLSLSPRPDAVLATFRTRFPVREIEQCARELDTKVKCLAHVIRLIDNYHESGHRNLLARVRHIAAEIIHRQSGLQTVGFPREYFPVPEVVELREGGEVRGDDQSDIFEADG
jgi:hypothetical protein